MILVPAHRYFSFDVWRKPDLKTTQVPAWCINIIKFQLAVVYFYAGLAKLNPDWLFNAMPLKIWLPANAHLPVIGGLLEMEITAYIFSWSGAIYDLFVPFFLLYNRTRVWAYGAVIGFHLMTSLLFQIGMFPYIMILSTLIFFSPTFHEQLITQVRRLFGSSSYDSASTLKYRLNSKATSFMMTGLAVYVALQILLPFRYALYPGNLYWTEQGYRFSWRVMLMEKAGYAIFHITDPETGRSWEASNWEYLTPVQEKMMATQPDMILQFAHHLEEEYQKQGINDVEVRAEVYATLNGRRSRLLVDSDQDLTKVKPGLGHKDWILPYSSDQEIKLHTSNTP